tara:strand:+ start:114 stop:1421 length:1308 start_codon:yes stop_codon:yes gene_type:complete
VATTIFLAIPSFFDYEKRSNVIKDTIFKTYKLKISQIEKIEFKFFPLPNLELKNVSIDNEKSSRIFQIENFKIFPKFISLYSFENLKINKIILNRGDVSLDTHGIKRLIIKFLNQKNKISLNKLDLQIFDNDKSILKIKNIKYSNFGYSKNLIEGEVFNKKFRLKLSKNLQNFNFKIFKSGISADINLDKKNTDLVTGIFKAKILNTNVKFNFNLTDYQINIFNSYFRNKHISFRNDNLIFFNPFFEAKSNFYIDHFDFKIFNNFDFDKLIEFKEIFKKINSKNKINFKAKKFSQNLIDELFIEADFAYGTVKFLKKLRISDNHFICKGDINFLEEFPTIFFECFFNLNHRNNFLKKFSIKQIKKNQKLEINVIGNLGILNDKINFKSISTNNNYEASKEDLEYFKKNFERLVYNQSFFEIFKLKKIRNFILEIS